MGIDPYTACVTKTVALRRSGIAGTARDVGARRDSTRSRAFGFTLVELLIVVVILGILAGLAIPYFQEEGLETRIVSTQTTLRTIDTAVDLYRVRYTRSSYPSTIMPAWFVGNRVPPNPLSSDGAPQGDVEVVNVSGALNPANRVLGSGIAQYWYNRATGIVRARVPSQSTSTETNQLYARVNGVTRSAGIGGIGAPRISKGGSLDATVDVPAQGALEQAEAVVEGAKKN